MSSISEIDLSDNKLGPSAPKLNLPSLKTLLMPHNRFVDIRRLGDSKLSQLEKLVLSHNIIEGIAPMNMGLLKSLDLSNNKLKSLE